MKTYLERSEFCSNPTAKKLLALMEHKKTNLAVAADVTSAHELLNLADQLGPEICLFKTHIDIIEDFTPALTHELRKLSDRHQFLIFEDRKFADIGNTVALQYSAGVYHISDWADIINAHSVPGPGIIAGLKKVGLPKGQGLLLLAEMSSQGTLARGNYTAETVSMAEQNDDFVIGFISMGGLSIDPKWIHMTPGVQLAEGKDSLGQQYQTPASVIAGGTDVIIVGRGIYEAEDPVSMAKHYKRAGWEAYVKRCTHA